MTMVVMRVHIDCDGCVSKIKKVLQKLDGVEEIDIDICNQKVTVMGWADETKVLKTVRKTGRRAELWPLPYNPDYYELWPYSYNPDYYALWPYPYKPDYYYFTQRQDYCYQHQQYQVSSYYTTPQPSSSSSFSYGGYGYGYFQQSPYSLIIDERTTNMFSDDNPDACSIM